jgi:integrase
MAGRLTEAKIDSRSARERLKRGRQPHWRMIEKGRVHLGYQRDKGEPTGRWLLRRYLRRHPVKNANGKETLITNYSTITLGLADDAVEANGKTVLSFEQAEAKARAMVATPSSRPARLTVKEAMQRYFDFKRDEGQDTEDMEGRSRVHILPELGSLVVAELTAEQLGRWRTGMADRPAQRRPKQGKPQYAERADTDDKVRARRASANRILTLLKAALNHAFDEGHVGNRDAWGRRLKPYRNVDKARIDYFQIAEAERLINGSAEDFRSLVRGALETGARYSELARLEVRDFNRDAGTLSVRRSKSDKPRHIVLTPEGAAFFTGHCAGRQGSERMFRHADGSAWKKSEQARPMRDACAHAKITPAVGFHQLRHTWASHAVMNGVPLMIVAQNLGHRDTRMVEKHYGHLAPSFITQAIHAGAPRFAVATDSKITPLR